MGKFIYLLVLLSFMGIQSFAQKTITGTVTSSEDGSPIPGATISVQNTTTGTITDVNGKYSLEVPSSADTLVFSFIGMNTVKKAVNGQSVVNVKMVSAVEKLDELVVTALGISREKKALGYAIEDVKGDELAKAKETNIVNSLSGKVAGAQVTSASGAVGASSRIVIRGNSSFVNSQPLWIVDGVPISNKSSDVSQWGATDFGNAAMDLDPSDIESMTILKGANAAALYGSRAANGVIVITTKSGKNKKKGLGVAISSSVTIGQSYHFVKYQNEYGQGYNGSEYYYVNTGAKASGVSYQDFADGSYNPSMGFNYFDGGMGGEKGVYDGMDESWGPRLDIGLNIRQFNSPLTDPNDPSTRTATPWVSRPDNVKDFFETGITFDNNATITSNGDAGNMRLSLGQQDIKGAIPNTDLTKYNVSFTGTEKLAKWLSAGVSTNYVNNHSDNLPGQGYGPNNIMQSLGGWFGRQVDIKDLKSNWETSNVFGNPYNWNSNYHNNPYWTLNNNTTSRTRDRIFGNAHVDATISDWLKITGRIGTDFYSEQRKHVDYNQSIDHPLGSFWQSQRRNMELNADFFASVNKKFGDIGVSGIVGGNYRKVEYHRMYLEAKELTVPNLFTISNVNGNPTTSMFDEEKCTNSIYGQASVDWKRAIFLDATLRNDWSSTLPSDNWSYIYPSVTLSTIVSDLVEMPKDIVSFVKVRGGIAKVGNDTDPYQLESVFTGDDPFGGVTPFGTGKVVSSLRIMAANRLEPEDITSAEVGLNLKFLNNRIGLDFTYYDVVTKKQIMKVNISTATGYDSKLLNAGEIENKGVELQLNADIVKNDNGFNWNMNINWAKNNNKVNSLYGDLKAYQITSSWNGVTIEARPGQPFGVIKANAFLRDANGNKIIGSNGLPEAALSPLAVGNITPDWTGGIKNTFTYKNLSFSFLIDGRYGGDIFSVSDWFGSYSGLLAKTTEDGIREHGLVVKGVKEDGTPNDVVVSAQKYYEGYWGLEENSVIDGTYIKLREIVISYDIPKNIIDKIGFIRGASVAFVGRNLGILYTDPSNSAGIDPETGFGANLNGIGLEQFQLPPTRTYGFKLNLNF